MIPHCMVKHNPRGICCGGCVFVMEKGKIQNACYSATKGEAGMGNLFLNRNKTIAVMMGNQRGGFIERCWEALATHARVRSCNLLVLPGEIDLYAGAQGDRYDEAYAFVRAGNVDGVVVMGGNINFQNRYADIVSAEGARRLGLPVAVLARACGCIGKEWMWYCGMRMTVSAFHRRCGTACSILFTPPYGRREARASGCMLPTMP